MAEDFHPEGGTADFLPHSFHATSIGAMLKSQNQLGARCPVPIPPRSAAYEQVDIRMTRCSTKATSTDSATWAESIEAACCLVICFDFLKETVNLPKKYLLSSMRNESCTNLIRVENKFITENTY